MPKKARVIKAQTKIEVVELDRDEEIEKLLKR
jgi:hypothetical protein